MRTKPSLPALTALAVLALATAPTPAHAADATPAAGAGAAGAPAAPGTAPATAATGARPPQAVAPGQVPGTILLTVFLRHDQSKNLTQINDELWRNGYFDQFPPEGVEVVSWYVVMNIGQIVTLRVPAEKLREVNVVLERTAWGPYRTDFHPTYDYKQLAEQQRQQMRARKK